MSLSLSEEEGEKEQKEVWYYSTRQQLEELMEVLDGQYWEADLCAALEEVKEEAHTHMDVTDELTGKARGNNKAYLTAANGELGRPILGGEQKRTLVGVPPSREG